MPAVRNTHIDFAKALAMTLVVMQHAWSMLGMDDPAWGWVCSAYRSISTIGVSLFVLISGALILPHKIEPLGAFYKKRLLRLLPPFVLFATMMYVAALLMGNYDWWDGTLKQAVIQYIPMLLENRINDIHWFVYMLTALTLITPFLQRTLQALSRREVEAILLIWIAGMLLQQYYPQMGLSPYFPTYWQHIGIYIAGYYLIKFCTASRRALYIGIGATVVLIAVDILTACACRLGVPMTAVALGVICLNLPQGARTSLWQQCVTNCSRYSYTIYLIHVLLVGAIYHWISIPSEWMPWTPLIVTPVIMVVTYGLCKLYDKIGWLPNKLIGIG